VDFTDAAHPIEIAYLDRGSIPIFCRYIRQLIQIFDNEVAAARLLRNISRQSGTRRLLRRPAALLYRLVIALRPLRTCCGRVELCVKIELKRRDRLTASSRPR
jgi:hypothetical protein